MTTSPSRSILVNCSTSCCAGPADAAPKRPWSNPLAPDYALLKIDGIDTDGGLKRLGGKRERYESLLKKFATRQAGTVDAMRTALASGDVATAERDAHSLKGSAATLGADRVAEEAGKAEAAIKS